MYLFCSCYQIVGQYHWPVIGSFEGKEAMVRSHQFYPYEHARLRNFLELQLLRPFDRLKNDTKKSQRPVPSHRRISSAKH